MSKTDLVDPEVAATREVNNEAKDAPAADSLPLSEEHSNKHDDPRPDAFRKGKKAGRPRKPRPEILSLEEYDRDEGKDFDNSDDNESDPADGIETAIEGKEKVTDRKRGRPRSKLLDDAPQREKKKRGRPKDETRSNVTCDICGKFFKYRVLLKRHEQTHYGIKEFECEFCHKRFLQKGGLTVHLRQHTGERPYKCPYCPASFRGQSSLDCHVFRHTKQGTKCPQCPAVFATPAIVKQHIREVHTTEKPHTCQICGESYKHRKSLTTHLEDHDKRICSVCGKVFNTMFALMTHRHIHEVNPKCNYCGRSFKSDEELQAHSKLRGRVYQCEMCCYSFNKAEFLDNHHRRDHWNALGLERLARKIVPRPKKPKPDGPKGKKSRPALPIVAMGETTELDGAENLEASLVPFMPPVEASQQTIPVEQSIGTQSIGAPDETPPSTFNANVEPLPTKLDSPSPTKHEQTEKDGESQLHSDSDYPDDYPLDDVHDNDSDADDLNLDDEKTVCQPKVEIKDEVESQMGELTAPPSLEPGNFLKIEIAESDKPVENPEEEASAPKEDPIDDGQVEVLEEKKEELSDSEDDDVPLAALKSASRSKTPVACPPKKRKLPAPESQKKSLPNPSEDSSSDDGKLYSIGDPSDSDRSSEDEEDDIEIEKPKPKRKRRRKQSGDKGIKLPNRKRGINCALCGDVFQSKAALKEHKKSVHPDEKTNGGPLICELCGKSYATITSLTVHRSQHKEYQRFKCDECPKAFTFQCYLENHKRIEHRHERLICPLCGKLFKYGPDLKRHSLQHEEEKPFKCEECPAAFRHPSALHSHKAIHEKLVFTCPICNKDFRYANSLRVHKRLHSGVKRFRCEICDREFSQKAPLMKHMSIHSVDRQVKCAVCDKVYYKKVELIIHQAKEHPNHPLIGKTIKIHACKICGMEFTKEGHLRIHSDIHGDDYRFKCDMCEDQKFKQKAGLRHHWKHFHRMEPPKRNLGKKPEEKKIEKVVVRTVTGADLRPPALIGDMNNDFEFMMQRMECEVAASN